MRLAGNGIQQYYGTLSIVAPAGASPAVLVFPGTTTNSTTPAISVRAPAASYATISVAGNNNSPGSSSLDLIQANDSVGYLYQRGANQLNLGTNNTAAISINGSRAVAIQAPAAGSVALTVNGVAGTDPAIINSASVNDRASILFEQAGAGLAYAGVDGNQSLVADSSNGDFVIRSNNKAIRFSVNSGTGSNIRIAAGGGMTIVQPTSGNALSTVGNVVIGNAASGLPCTIYEQLNNINAQKTAATFEVGSFTGTLTGCTTAPTATLNYSRNGNSVTIDMTNNLTATSNANTCTITGLPAALSPARIANAMCVIQDNSTKAFGYCQIAGTTINFIPSAAGASNTWTTSGSKGVIGGFTITYNLT